MSYVTAVPEMMASAATDVAAIGSAVSAAHTAAAASTVAMLPAAADEVSTSIAQLFSGFAQEFQGLVAQAAVFGQHFGQNLIAAARLYAANENFSAASLGQAIAAVPGEILATPGDILRFVSNLAININLLRALLVNLGALTYGATILGVSVTYATLAFTIVLLEALVFLKFGLSL